MYKCLFTVDRSLKTEQNNHHTKVQVGQSMSLLHLFADYRQGVTYRSMDYPKTAATL